jgi:hypothetical protein
MVLGIDPSEDRPRLIPRSVVSIQAVPEATKDRKPDAFED